MEVDFCGKWTPPIYLGLYVHGLQSTFVWIHLQVDPASQEQVSEFLNGNAIDELMGSGDKDTLLMVLQTKSKVIEQTSEESLVDKPAIEVEDEKPMSPLQKAQSVALAKGKVSRVSPTAIFAELHLNLAVLL